MEAGNYRLHVGDHLATRHNDRQLHTDWSPMVKNRDRWEIDAVQVDRSFLLLDGPADTRGVYMPMTRGRDVNEAFVVVEGEQAALDVLAQALARDWIDEPAVARRVVLQRSTPQRWGRSHGRLLEPAELRGLLERRHTITEALSTTESRASRYAGQVARATKRHAELVERLAAATAVRDEAMQVVDDHDHPLQRRFHRSEFGSGPCEPPAGPTRSSNVRARSWPISTTAVRTAIGAPPGRADAAGPAGSGSGGTLDRP